MTRDEIFRSFEARWLKDARFPSELKTPFTLEWLPGDASNRFYGRLQFGSKKSVIIMMVNAPEAFKSEEVTGSDESKLQEMPFVIIDRAFEKMGLRVPHIHYVDPKNEFMLLEDFGGELLYDRRQKDPAHAWYAKARISTCSRGSGVRVDPRSCMLCCTPDRYHTFYVSRMSSQCCVLSYKAVPFLHSARATPTRSPPSCSSLAPRTPPPALPASPGGAR